jgi:hypothetical protein
VEGRGEWIPWILLATFGGVLLMDMLCSVLTQFTARSPSKHIPKTFGKSYKASLHNVFLAVPNHNLPQHHLTST